MGTKATTPTNSSGLSAGENGFRSSKTNHDKNYFSTGDYSCEKCLGSSHGEGGFINLVAK
jgi:hypothetical protein